MSNNILPKLKKSLNNKKKYHYKLNGTVRSRRLAINEGINYENKEMGKPLKRAATAKKGRLNILRIYRRYRKIDECNTITNDMRYIDRKYNLGKTKNICGKQMGGGDTYKNCCKSSKKTKKCVRGYDNKVFSLPRRFSKTKCIKGPIKGFTMRASCAPYNKCKMNGGKSKRFLFNPNNPKKSFDVYIDKDPSDTINIKYATINDVKKTIEKLEHLFKTKKYTHKRIWQVGMIMKVRLGAILKHKNTRYKNAKDIEKRYKLANRYFLFLGSRSKKKSFTERAKMIFN